MKMPCKIKLTLPIVPESPKGNERILKLVSCKGGGQYLNDHGDRVELRGKGFIVHLHDWGVQESDGISRTLDLDQPITIQGLQ